MADEKLGQKNFKVFSLLYQDLDGGHLRVEASDLKGLPQATLKRLAKAFPMPLPLLTCAGMRFISFGEQGEQLDMSNPSPADEKALHQLGYRLQWLTTDLITAEDMQAMRYAKKNKRDFEPSTKSVRAHILAIINQEPQDAKQSVDAWVAKYDLPFRTYFSTYVVEVAGAKRRLTESDIAKVWVKLSDEDHEKFHKSFAANHPGKKMLAAGASPSVSGSGSGSLFSKLVKKITGGVGAGSPHEKPSGGPQPPSGPPK